MSNQSPLIVPLMVEALVVNDHVRLGGNAFLRAQMQYNALQQCANGQPGLNNNDTNFTKPNAVPPHGVSAADYYNGVYLKWRMPQAFTHGTQASATGITTYPALPNRWLIIRMSGPLDSRQVTAWIIESDYVWPSPPSPQDASQVGSIYVGPQSQTNNTPVGIYIGRNVQLGAWTEPGTSLDLTVMAPGNPAFAFYQPQNNNVFSFIDVLGQADDETLSYQVIGWFSSSSDDPLDGATVSTFAARLAARAWTLPPGTDSSLFASWTLLSGSVSGVQWQTSTQPAGGAPHGTPVSVAVGNTSIEALTALVAAQAEAQGVAIDAQLLEAFQLDMIDVLDEPDGAALLAEKLHASFFQRFAGGYSWTIVDAEGTTTPVSDAELDKELAWLTTLNADQASLDEAIRTLITVQMQLYVAWWKYTYWPWAFQGSTSITGLDDQTALGNQIDPSVSESIAQRTASQLATVQTLRAKVPTGDTPDALQAAIAAYAAKQGLPSTRVLKRAAEPSFYLPNNPVVLLAGAGASGIAADPDTVLCRFGSQLVTGFTYAGQPIDADTGGLTIPAPDLAQVSGVPWSAADVEALVQEFFFTDPNNATIVSAAVAGSSVESIAAAMAAPSNAIGSYPTGAVQTWTQNPWRPLLLLYQVSYYPISYGSIDSPNWMFENGEYVWNGAAGSVEPSTVLSGLIQLAPTAALNMEARIEAFLANNPGLDPTTRTEFEALLELVRTSDQWDLLSQSLNGFNEQLRLSMAGVFIGPESTAPTLATLIGDVDGYPPGLPPIPTGAIPASQFQPWRSGQFVFMNLLVVDEWGQALWPIDQFTQATETVYLPPDLTPVRVSNAVPFEITAAAGQADAGSQVPVSSALTITSLMPNLMQAGTAPSAQFTIFITGTGFAADSAVEWNGTALDTTVISGTQVSGSVPASYITAPGHNSVTVRSGGVTSAAATFTVSPGAAIGALSPASATAGGPAFTLTVTGVGFQPRSVVAWNGAPLSTTYVNDTQLTAQVPANLVAAASSATITEQFGTQVVANVPDSYVQLPPRLLQPGRLDFDLLSATNDSVKFGPTAPNADPICGWVLPNHLDGSLMAYDANGSALGEISIGMSSSDQAQVCWTPAPGSPSTLQQLAQAIPHFGAFLLALSQQQPATFSAFLEHIDETLWTTVPMGAAFDQSLAVLMGRPLALVRARVQFEFDGMAYGDPSWQYTFTPQTPAITGYEFAVELGDVAQLDDGLIGYFVGDDYDTFNIVQQAGATASAYLRPIGVDNNYLYLGFNGTAAYVSMLVDPRASVHATTAILPTVSVELPPQFVTDVLDAINVTFRVDGVLTDQTIGAGATPTTTVLLPVPKLNAGTWSWVEDAGAGWATYPTGPNDTVARLSTVAPVLRRGLLQLASALGATPTAEVTRAIRRRRNSFTRLNNLAAPPTPPAEHSMTRYKKPNAWVEYDDASTTQLTYAVKTEPAPLSVSVPQQTPVLASLEFVITNATSDSVDVSAISFIIQVGTTAASLTPTTAGVLTQASDTANWIITGPPSPITSGSATYTLGPATGSNVNLPAGASVVVQIYQIQTEQVPGTSTIAIKEIILGSPPSFMNVSVTTFPDGFYFNALATTVVQGSALVPVAQVDTGSTVTLVWNSSVVETSAIQILYSSAASGQQTATPSEIGAWTSPALTSDTVFTVVVEVASTGGEPLTASLSTTVSVQNPVIIAESVTSGTLTVTGNTDLAGTVIAESVTSGTLTVTGNTDLAGTVGPLTGDAGGESNFLQTESADNAALILKNTIAFNSIHTMTASGLLIDVAAASDPALRTNGLIQSELTISGAQRTTTALLSISPQLVLSGSSQLGSGITTVDFGSLTGLITMPYVVMVTATDNFANFRAFNKTTTSFQVAGTSDSATFDWLVIAPRSDVLSSTLDRTAAAVRRISAVTRNKSGSIVSVHAPGESWSPRAVEDVIADIESGRCEYRTSPADGAIHVVHGASGKHLRSGPDDNPDNNLDKLPDA